MAEPQKEQNGVYSFLATTDSNVKQGYRTALCGLKHTRSSNKPAVYMDRVLSFDASSGMYGGEDSALEVGSGKVRGGRGSVLGKGMKRARSRREQDGGDAFLDTTDTSIKQQYRSLLGVEAYTQQLQTSHFYG